MALTNGKRIAATEIDGIRCAVVEDKATASRVQFLKSLLEFNKFEVKVSENPKKDESEATTYSIGVTDVTFNAVIAVYEKKLWTRKGKVVTPAFWNQDTDDTNVPYWTFGRPIIGIYREEC